MSKSFAEQFFGSEPSTPELPDIESSDEFYSPTNYEIPYSSDDSMNTEELVERKEELKKEIKKEDCLDQSLHISMIQLKNAVYPVTVTWDNSLFNDPCRINSIITDWHPVGWFDAIVGSSMPIAVGLAWANMLKKSNNVVVVFFGDGAIEEGSFHESLNFASLNSLLILLNL